MRQSIRRQLPLVPVLREHAHVAELREMSRVLDENPGIAGLAHADLVRGKRADTGREGLSADQVVRAAILYQSNGWSFEQLAFELTFHAAYRGFWRLGLDQYPS